MIRSGGLDAGPGNSQMPPDTWRSLARLNDLGMVTIDSQPGEDSSERAYVDGFMLEEHALRFVEAMNCDGDKVAVLVRPSPEWQRSNIVLTRLNKRHSVTRLPLYVDGPTYTELKTQFDGQGSGAGIDADVNAVLVCVFDPTWGRHCNAKPDGLFPCILRVLRSLLR